MKSVTTYITAKQYFHCYCNGFHKYERLFMIMVKQVPKRWNISLNLPEYVPQLSTPLWYLSTTIIDIDTYRRRIGDFNNNRHMKEKRKKNQQRKRSCLKTIYSLHIVIFVTAITVYIFSTTLWLPQDSWSGKKHAKRKYLQIIRLYKWERKSSFQQTKNTTLTIDKS